MPFVPMCVFVQKQVHFVGETGKSCFIYHTFLLELFSCFVYQICSNHLQYKVFANTCTIKTDMIKSHFQQQYAHVCMFYHKISDIGHTQYPQFKMSINCTSCIFYYQSTTDRNIIHVKIIYRCIHIKKCKFICIYNICNKLPIIYLSQPYLKNLRISF